jgi:hypothetical protein
MLKPHAKPSKARVIYLLHDSDFPHASSLNQSRRRRRLRVLDLDPAGRVPQALRLIPAFDDYAFQPELPGVPKHAVAVGAVEFG